MKSPLFILLCLLYSCAQETKKTVVIKNKEVPIAYRLSGTGDTALVFVHGWCINKEDWKSQQDYFGNRFTTVAIDLGGHGQSGTNRNTWNVEDYADDVMAVIDGLQLKKVILIGHSMSGDIGLVAANRAPDIIVGFVGIDNLKNIITSFSAEEQKGIDDFFAAMQTNFDTVATNYCYNYLFPKGYTDTASMNRVVRNVQQIDSTIAIETLKDLIPATFKEGGWLSGLHIPLHLIVSNDLGPVNDSVVRSYCKEGLYIKNIEGVGHYPMIEKPEKFNKLLEETVNDIAKK